MACYTLMNKDYPVLEFEYDLKSRVVTRIVRMVDAARALLGLIDERGRTSKRDLNYWWRHRAIPASREQVEHLLENLRLDSTLELVERTFGLSLADRYWINDVDAPQRWCDVNFFDNDFSDDLGILTLGQDASTSMERSDYARVNLNSPSSTVDGDLRKKWKIIDGKRVLVKSGVGFVNRSLISFGEGRVHGIPFGEGGSVGFPFGEGLSAGFPFGVGDSAGFSFGEPRQTRFRQAEPRQTRFQQIAGLVP